MFGQPPVNSANDCCLACYDPSITANCNGWRWSGGCIVVSGGVPGNNANSMCPGGHGDLILESFGDGSDLAGEGPCMAARA